MHNRRHFLKTASLSAGALLYAPAIFGRHSDSESPLPVAGVVTVYNQNSHADVILGKILEGYDQQGGPGPKLKLASIYFDQPRNSDLGLELALKEDGLQFTRAQVGDPPADQSPTTGRRQNPAPSPPSPPRRSEAT